ncbi:MAG: methionine synthase [Candidatus Eremiobacteraeota bacterium]|nr:methionine synthase [Candidatus Eremiobacteraeota bacterium]MBV8365671.1 methionine synthase [Candidatus Eremiobacteraeota bacterium]
MDVRSTIAGSLPKPAWLAEPETLWAKWRLDGPALADAKRDATRIALFEQERAGITCVTDGEQSRQHFVHGFLTHVEGVDFSKMVRRGIRADRYQADVPTVTGPVRRVGPAHLDEATFARRHTKRRLKMTIPGPMTIVDTVSDAHYKDRRELAMAFAALIREEIAGLESVGVYVVQLDEPALNAYLDEAEAWGMEAIDAAVRDASCRTAVHVCYGYGIKANVDWKRSLGQSWDQYERLLPLLAKTNIDEISIELAGSHVPAAVLGSAGRKDVAIGVIDVATDRVEAPEDVVATINTARAYLPDERIIASTNCGMAPMRRDVAYAKLQALGAGVALANS